MASAKLYFEIISIACLRGQMPNIVLDWPREVTQWISSGANHFTSSTPRSRLTNSEVILRISPSGCFKPTLNAGNNNSLGAAFVILTFAKLVISAATDSSKTDLQRSPLAICRGSSQRISSASVAFRTIAPNILSSSLAESSGFNPMSASAAFARTQ